MRFIDTFEFYNGKIILHMWKVKKITDLEMSMFWEITNYSILV